MALLHTIKKFPPICKAVQPVAEQRLNGRNAQVPRKRLLCATWGEKRYGYGACGRHLRLLRGLDLPQPEMPADVSPRLNTGGDAHRAGVLRYSLRFDKCSHAAGSYTTASGIDSFTYVKGHLIPQPWRSMEDAANAGTHATVP